MSDEAPTQAEVQAWLELRDRATPEPWEFRDGNDREGDSVDLLMAEVGHAEPDEDPEYAEVFFGPDSFGEAQVSANWELAREAGNSFKRLARAYQEAMELLTRIHLAASSSVGYNGASTLGDEAAEALRKWRDTK